MDDVAVIATVMEERLGDKVSGWDICLEGKGG